jgi:hypothetical protein
MEATEQFISCVRRAKRNAAKYHCPHMVWFDGWNYQVNFYESANKLIAIVVVWEDGSISSPLASSLRKRATESIEER